MTRSVVHQRHKAWGGVGESLAGGSAQVSAQILWCWDSNFTFHEMVPKSHIYRMQELGQHLTATPWHVCLYRYGGAQVHIPL